MVQIDGLSERDLRTALANGRMPFIARLLAQEGHVLTALYSGLPSSTPAVQGELFYGKRTVVPAFAFRAHAAERLVSMSEPARVRAIERELSAGSAVPLLRGGSAYGDIYTGGAREPHFCVASLGWRALLGNLGPLRWAWAVARHLPALLRTAMLTALEVALAFGEALFGMLSGNAPGIELRAVPMRVLVSVLMRDLITIGARADIARGMPIVHVNYLGYDEQAHTRGPDAAFAHRTLSAIDRRTESLWHAVRRARKQHYELWVYSDHGQEKCVPYASRHGRTLEHTLQVALEALWPGRRGRVAGPVAHVYLEPPLVNVIERVRLAGRLVVEGSVPAALFIGADGKLRACVGMRALLLPRDAGMLFGAGRSQLEEVHDDLLALVRHPDAGELVLLGWAAGVPAVSFAQENGAHGGVGPRECGAFAVLPVRIAGALDSCVRLRPSTLRAYALARRGTPAQTECRERRR